MGVILWGLAVVCAGLGVVTLVAGHAAGGILLIVLATVFGFAASASALNLE